MSNNSKVISDITLRRTIGFLGMLLPVISAVGAIVCGECDGILKSVSLYYNTVMRNVFVGILFAFAFFMFAYRGYDIKDRIAGMLASVFALGIAFFPASPDFVVNCNYIIPELKRASWIRPAHLTSALLFFLTLTYFSLFLFTRTDKEVLNTEKKRRNLVYRICGFIMLGSILSIIAWMLFFDGKYPDFEKYHPIFWLETLALWAFGISWLVKGETVLKDKT